MGCSKSKYQVREQVVDQYFRSYDGVAVAVVVTLHTCIGAHLALFGCRDFDGSEGQLERALSLATFKNSIKLGIIDRA